MINQSTFKEIKRLYIKHKENVRTLSTGTKIGSLEEAERFASSGQTRVTYYHNTSAVKQIKEQGFKLGGSYGVVYFSGGSPIDGSDVIEVKLKPKKGYDYDKNPNEWFDWIDSKGIKEEDTDVWTSKEFMKEKGYDTYYSESGDVFTIVLDPSTIFIID